MLKRNVLRTWIRLKERKEVEEHKLLQFEKAQRHHKSKLILSVLWEWKAWIIVRNSFWAVATSVLVDFFNHSICKIVFRAWRTFTADVMEVKNCDLMMEVQTLNETVESFTDNFSSLPNDVITKIFSCLDIHDLLRCASVCQLWKTCTLSPMLWSKYSCQRRNE
uniref:F-box domain-containing protein n=1 Tax=Eptatretus burgeri TaxID=7764 RepID=A0A8C4QJF9_EPTBU